MFATQQSYKGIVYWKCVIFLDLLIRCVFDGGNRNPCVRGLQGCDVCGKPTTSGAIHIRYKMFCPRQRNNAILILCLQMERYPINDVVVYGL